ncbi:hypothetical protein BDW71DRAFT_186071, partial [Aspergillus fruticulosus]
MQQVFACRKPSFSLVNLSNVHSVVYLLVSRSHTLPSFPCIFGSNTCTVVLMLLSSILYISRLQGSICQFLRCHKSL